MTTNTSSATSIIELAFTQMASASCFDNYSTATIEWDQGEAEGWLAEIAEGYVALGVTFDENDQLCPCLVDCI